ncbi:putative Late nodulin [Medicago truncatula]|uniref:Putative Late nodulin n=1 Tax=Medicago truncatula TaxID=3880 RepID=I3SL05_MEDTR|nr:unknown [Medicago truncatula]RHN56115.1 putative Late nodulin [Medicago truncatula]
MQRDKNMTKTFDFVYATIIFSFLFFAEKNVVAYIIECKTDNDCPISQLKIYAWKCVKNGCHLFDVIPMMYE